MAKYPAPGRGAWRFAGGLLPGSPSSKSKIGYYRLAAKNETPVGSGWLREEDDSHDAYCVYLGVRAIQSLVGVEADGWFGPDTSKAVVAAQKKNAVADDGVVGPATMKAILTPLVQELATHNNVPVSILGGLLVNESGLDPAAVGVNGQDHGLAQINLGAHPRTTVEEAMDPDYSIFFTVEALSNTYANWLGVAKANAWDIAIAAHNSPALARKWALEGKAPVVEGRPFQIADYVARVRGSW